MTQPEIAIKVLRTVHAVLIMSIILYAFVAEKVMQRSTSAPARSLVTGMTILAIIMIVVALSVRRRMVSPAKEKLEVEAGDVSALNRWRTGSLISLVFVESVALYGFVLRVMGGTRSQALPFYLVAILIMLLWTPRLDVASS
jgi:hypothetical protein